MEIINAKPGHIYIVGYIYRPGCPTFTTELEHRHYPPNSEANDLFTVYMVKYSDMLFNVVEIPDNRTAREHCYRISSECSLRMVPGKPWNGREEFPVNCKPDKCYTLETVNHSTYANRNLKQVVQEEADGLRQKYCNNT